MEYRELRERLYAVVKSVEPSLRAVDPLPTPENVNAEIDAGEYALALDTLCTQLYEYDVGVPRPILDEIAVLAEASGLPDRLWRALRIE